MRVLKAWRKLATFLPIFFLICEKTCGNQILQAPCVHFQRALNVQLINILHFWILGRWLWLKKQKAHGFNTAVMINLCALFHWTKKDKSQTDALIYLCGFTCKDTATHKENHLKMHWALWIKDSKYRDHQPPFSFTWEEHNHNQYNLLVYNKIFSTFTPGLSSQVALYQTKISAIHKFWFYQPAKVWGDVGERSEM